MITLTNEAKNKIKDLLDNRSENFIGLRIGVSTSGCGGFAYQLEWANDIEETDKIVKIDNDISLMYNKKWHYVFDGVELDYKIEGLNEGFDFNNPNEKARCGCGESFSI